ncbi:MAG: UDP-glucose/GDP-mannose dehydrogenase family protein [Gemmatimonadaceae bacterium]|jgi:GDP-mannose 6-dehydrogenase|nr:UDP-glucose/GDP-mannose dehydrogenase family protein [Gemmatimonadaceae bacterium]
MTALSVFGLGYVGCVSAACLAREGHTIVGVDVNETKVSLINSGRPTIVEDGIADLVAGQVAAGRLRATTDVREAVLTTDMSLVCVGTPSRANGALDLRYVERVCEQIGEALAAKATRHVVVIRSTVLPGTVHEVVIPALERGSGRRAGTDFGVAMNPEFLREGTSIRDFADPPFTLIGADDGATGDAVAALYATLDAPVHRIAVREAEMVKYACNCFHGLKVAFANEIGNVAKGLGVDSHEVMRIVCEDRKLNISPAYLKPGFAFGGSCLPKDLRALTHRARELDLETPVLRATLVSNTQQVQRAFEMVARTGKRRVGMLGMSFKPGTDDLRESPLVSLIELMVGKGLELAIYDRDVSEARLIGANREYIEGEIPHIWSLVRPSAAEVITHGDVVVVGNATGEIRALGAPAFAGKHVIDLARLFPTRPDGALAYDGICW